MTDWDKEGARLASDILTELAKDDALIERVRLRIEDELVDWRDNRRSMLCNNGLTIKEKDGRPSEIIRFRTDAAIRLMLQYMSEEVRQ